MYTAYQMITYREDPANATSKVEEVSYQTGYRHAPIPYTLRYCQGDGVTVYSSGSVDYPYPKYVAVKLYTYSSEEAHDELRDRIRALNCLLEKVDVDDDRSLLCRISNYQLTPITDDDTHSNILFLKSLALSQDNPTQISYAASPEHVLDNTRRRRVKFSKFLQILQHRGIIANLPSEVEQRLCQKWSKLVSKNRYTFEVVKGQAITDAYFAENDPDTCMHENEAVKLYEENPGNVSLVRILDCGEYMGRALLFTLDSGKKLLDRVYPDDCGAHIDIIRQWALDRGYIVRLGEGVNAEGFGVTGEGGVVERCTLDASDTLTLGYSEYFPYMDTMYVIVDADERVIKLASLSTSRLHYVGNVSGRMRKTDNTQPFSAVRCNECGCPVSDDDVCVVDGTYRFCQECFDDKFVYDRNGEVYARDEVTICYLCSQYSENDEVHSVASPDGDISVCEYCIDRKGLYCHDCDVYTYPSMHTCSPDADVTDEDKADRQTEEVA